MKNVIRLENYTYIKNNYANILLKYVQYLRN